MMRKPSKMVRISLFKTVEIKGWQEAVGRQHLLKKYG